jgi:hypothetical protein
MSKRRQELIEQRRQAALEVKVQRDTIARIMEEAKRNRARAARMLQEAMGDSKPGSKAKATISTTRPATTAGETSSSSISGSKQQQGAMSKSQSAAASVMRRSKSAQAGTVSDSSGGLGPAPEAPSLEARLKGSSNTRSELLGAPQAYVSPYEQVLQPPQATTVTL